FTSALRESHDPREQAHLAERVDAALRAAEELLDGLLDVSRLDAGKLKPEIGSFDAGALLRELAAQYAPMAAARSINVRVHAPPLVVRSDRRLLRRVLQNFIANALRYTPRGRVVLAARRRGDQVALQVWDAGPGIPEHHMRQIYDEFHRFEQPFDWDGRGLGRATCQGCPGLLAPALVAGAVAGHAGMFSILVPRGTAGAGWEPRRDAPRVDVDQALHGMTVVCVDNDRDILSGMHALLSR